MNTVLHKIFHDSLKESDRKAYRNCSINQQKEWYIHWLERKAIVQEMKPVELTEQYDSYEIKQGEKVRTIHNIDVATDGYSYDFFDTHELYAKRKDQ